MKQFSNRKTILAGFTLIELIVVIAIIGILATFVITNVASNLKRAKDSERINSLKQIQTALELYYQDYGVYPETNWINSQGQEGVRWIPALDEKYIKEMPLDPKNDGCSSSTVSPRQDGCYSLAYYSLGYCNLNGQGYILATRLEATDTTEFSQKSIIDPTTGSLCADTILSGTCQGSLKEKWSPCPIKGLYVLVNP